MLSSSVMAATAPPDLSNGSAGVITIAEEQQYGKLFMQMVHQRLPLVNDLVALDYVEHLGFQLASHSPRPSYPFNFFIVNDQQINAFAGPGGNIGINSGLILAVGAESELAAVLAHEIGHVVQRHFARGMARQKALEIPALLAMIASIAVGIAAPSAGMGALAATQAGMAQSGLHYSRQFEEEADNVGMGILQKSGFPISGMTKMLKQLMTSHFSNESEQEVLAPLMSHPSAAHRAAESMNILATQAPAKKHSNKLFELIQTRLAVDTSESPQDLANNDQALLSNPKNKNKDIIQYGYALALLKSGQIQRAEKVIANLVKSKPSELLYQLAHARTLAANQQSNTALALLKKLYENNSDYFPLMMFYAHQLLQNKQAKKGLSILQDYQGEFDNKTSYLSILATAQYKAGNHAVSDLTRSKLYVMMGQLFKARAILEIAEKQSKDPIIHAKISKALESVEKQIKHRKKW